MSNNPAFGWIAATALLVMPPVTAAAQDPAPGADVQLPDGAELLDEMEKLEGTSYDPTFRMSSAGESEFHIKMGEFEQKLKGEFVEYYDGSKVYHCSKYTGYKFEEGSDGEIAWEIDPMNGPTVLEGERLATKRRFWGLTRGDGWRMYYDDAVCTGSRVVDGDACWVVQMTPKFGKDETWYLRKDPLETRGLDVVMHTPNGEQEVRVRFGSWKRVGERTFPEVATIYADPVTIVFHNAEVDYDPEIPEDSFDLPKPVADLVAERDSTQEVSASQDDDFEVKLSEIGEAKVMSIRVKVPTEKIGETLGAIFPEVISHIGSSGSAPMGPPFTRFHGFEGGEIDMEAGFPVRTHLEETKRIKASVLPSGKVAIADHYGPFEKIGDSHERMEAWLKKREVETVDVRWEVYWTDPGREPDPQKWRTQIFWLLKQ